MPVTVLTEQDLRRIVAIDHDAVSAIEDGFKRLAEGGVMMPPIMHIEVPEHQGDVDVKSAYVPGLDLLAVKIGAGFFNNSQLGLPNSPAMMVALSAKTGMAEAILLDNAYLTDVRTAAAGAAAAKYLAPAEVRTAGVIGAGVQGRFQALALHRVRPFQRLLAYDTDPDRLADYVRDMAEALGVEAVAADSAEAVVRQSQAAVTSTPARSPYIRAEWLHSGLHITAMGADLPDKQELDPDVLKAADRVVCDRKAQCLEMGELHHAKKAGAIDEQSVVELGEVILGRAPGRTSASQITVCDLTGTGVQDTAVANLAVRKAAAAGLGMQVEG